MSQHEDTALRPTIKAHLPQDVAAALEVVVGEVFQRHLEDGVLHGESFVLVRARCACEELRVAVAALEEVAEAAEASGLSGEETVMAGRVLEVLPGLREAVGRLREAVRA